MYDNHSQYGPRPRFRRAKKVLYAPVHLGMCAGILVVVVFMMLRQRHPVPFTESPR